MILRLNTSTLQEDMQIYHNIYHTILIDHFDSNFEGRAYHDGEEGMVGRQGGS